MLTSDLYKKSTISIKVLKAFLDLKVKIRFVWVLINKFKEAEIKVGLVDF